MLSTTYVNWVNIYSVFPGYVFLLGIILIDLNAINDLQQY